MSKLRVQQYMEKHKLTPLFEELMNRVLHDQPDDPLVYMIKCLYRKAALPVPKDLKPGTLRRSSPERLGRRSKSPDKTATQAWAVGSGPDLVDRSYDKPWKSNSKKTRTKDEDRPQSPPKQGRKQKSGWVSDTKVTTTTFDELFEDDQQRSEPTVTRHKRDDNTDIKKAWAKNVGLDDSEDVNYRSRSYRGPRCHRNEEDPLSGEIMLASSDDKEQEVVSTSKSRGAKHETEKHRQELEKILNESEKVSMDSGFAGDKDDDVDDDAIELLEDPEDLQREGVTNISKSGYKLGRVLRQRQEEANVKLNINLFTGSAPESSEYGNQFDDYYESDLERPQTGMSYQSNRFSEYSPDVSDEEFESVSQVAGPRKPVWGVPDSDGETYRPDLSKTLPAPSKKTRQGKFSSTAPVKFDDRRPAQRPVDSENFFMQGGSKTPRQEISQKPPMPPSPTNVTALRDSIQSSRSQDGGGWNIPDDTEVSLATDWSEAPTTGRPSNGPPKAY